MLNLPQRPPYMLGQKLFNSCKMCFLILYRFECGHDLMVMEEGTECVNFPDS
jgi:hypothetical protein